ncbi:MAG: hypothetical protein Q8J70_10460 [Thiobacillus sp.]|nr:hypothetical protein [Thiobacillus sp.]
MSHQAIDKPDACPPKGLRRLRRRDAFDGSQRISHALETLLSVSIAQKSQQTSLKLRTRNFDCSSQRFL